MKLNIINLFFAIFLSFYSCKIDNQAIKSTSTNVSFIDKYIIPFDLHFNQTLVGGLSSIEYLPDGRWFFISDDRSEYAPSRLYNFEIDYSLEEGIDSVIFKELIYLKDQNSSLFNFDDIDPESLRFNAGSNTLFFSSEGGRTEGNTAPFIREISLAGDFIRQLSVPRQFDFYSDKKGLTDNGAFESLAFENDSILWFANELPLIEDGDFPQFDSTNSPVRLTKLNVKTNEVLAQYAYMIEPVQEKPTTEGGFNINSVVELLSLDANHLLVMERSYILGVGNYVRIFKVNLKGATDINSSNSLLDEQYVPVAKELIIDFSDYKEKIDNVEGMAFGKPFADGRKSLFCVSDNNFNDSQQTQLWLFAIDGI